MLETLVLIFLVGTLSTYHDYSMSQPQHHPAPNGDPVKPDSRHLEEVSNVGLDSKEGSTPPTHHYDSYPVGTRYRGRWAQFRYVPTNSCRSSDMLIPILT